MESFVQKNRMNLRPPLTLAAGMALTVCVIPFLAAGERISASNTHTCAIRTDGITPWEGSLVCWGDNSSGETDAPEGNDYTLVSTGEIHSCALTSSGTIRCWGYDFWSPPLTIPPSGTFRQVEVGGLHSCARRSDNTVVCWGENGNGQASSPPGAFQQVSGGFRHSCAVSLDGNVACWGLNNAGQTTVPTGQFVRVTAGGLHSCALRNDGSVTCWGSNSAGQASPPSTRFVEVDAGLVHTCGRLEDGHVQCWGRNAEGQTSPLPSGTFPEISTGYRHNCGMRLDGRIACWGEDTFGQSSPPDEIRWVPPSEATALLEALIDNLGLPEGTSNSLQAPLKKVTGLLDDGNQRNDGAGCGKLAEFIANVEAKVAAGHLDESTGIGMIAEAESIMADLGCSQ